MRNKWGIKGVRKHLRHPSGTGQCLVIQLKGRRSVSAQGSTDLSNIKMCIIFSVCIILKGLRETLSCD